MSSHRTSPEDLVKAVRVIANWFDQQAAKAAEDADCWGHVIRARSLDEAADVLESHNKILTHLLADGTTGDMEMNEPSCYCIKCHSEWASKQPKQNPPTFRIISSPLRYVCEICGNKRCPHHSDHRLACTNSNEPGQAGSIYE